MAKADRSERGTSEEREEFGPRRSESDDTPLPTSIINALKNDDITEEVELAVLDPKTAGKVVTLASEEARRRIGAVLVKRFENAA